MSFICFFDHEFASSRVDIGRNCRSTTIVKVEKSSNQKRKKNSLPISCLVKKADFALDLNRLGTRVPQRKGVMNRPPIDKLASPKYTCCSNQRHRDLITMIEIRVYLPFSAMHDWKGKRYNLII